MFFSSVSPVIQAFTDQGDIVTVTFCIGVEVSLKGFVGQNLECRPTQPWYCICETFLNYNIAKSHSFKDLSSLEWNLVKINYELKWLQLTL